MQGCNFCDQAPGFSFRASCFLPVLPYFCRPLKTEDVAQLVRATVCGTVGRGFETPRSPQSRNLSTQMRDRFLNFTVDVV